MICVSIGRTRHKMMIAEHQALAEKGAQLVELRLDWLDSKVDLPRLIQNRPTPVVITVRRQSDQGKWKGTEEERQTLLRTAIVAGVDYIDLEDDIAASIRRYGKTKRIVSHHDFQKTPTNIGDIYKYMCTLDPDIVKVVTMANSPADCVRMLKLVATAKKPTVAFCMGEFGVMSRVLCGKYGAPFTYATFNSERELAPGQLSYDQMRTLYRYDNINAETKIFGVLGDPIGHSLSPLLHNTLFKQRDMNAVYVPIRVSQDQLPKMLDDFEWFNFGGYSVTIPHKEALLKRVQDCDPLIKQIGAANTLYRDAKQAWQIANTDYQAALDSILLGIPEGETLEKKRVLLLGAGGAARAIACALKHAGAELTITSRTIKRAITLAGELGVRYITWEKRGTELAEILVNCTPVGMHPNVNDTPYPANCLRESMLVFDTIYTPERTLLLKEAQERGCRIVSGVEMFIRQAGAQFQLFTGEKPSLETLRDTLRRGISPVRKTS